MTSTTPVEPRELGGVISGGRRTLEDGGVVQESILDNGIHVLSEVVPGVRSVSTGVWIRQGSAHEGEGLRGISHLLEHMVFKGTERRSAREIALSLESLGGALDAYTTREHTSYQARILDQNLTEALDVLADLTLAPTLRSEDLELERQVVLEEIATVEDTPDDLVFEIHGERFWAGHPYGHSILGNRDTVERFTAEDLQDVHGKAYRGRNLVVAAAGNLDHDRVVALVEKHFGDLPAGDRTPVIERPSSHARGDDKLDRPGAQAHIVFGVPAVSHADPARYALVLLSSAFGGGMSSRLFQRVREELGLAYAVYSFHSFYSTSGMAGVYVGTRPEWEDRAAEAVREEMSTIAREGLEVEELAQTKQQVKGQIMLSLERTGSRLHRLANHALYGERFLGMGELLAKIDRVTAEEVAEAAARVFDPEKAYTFRLGPATEVTV